MAKLILRCPYLKSGSGAHLANYVKYIATRDGVDKISHANKTLPATVEQKKLIDRLVKDFPICKVMYEYEDYLQNPTRENASELITRALEDNYDQLGKRSNYVGYIANRPNVYKMGEHGLFSDIGESLALSDIARKVSEHTGNVWTHIISLRREDASRLGYDNAHQWQRFLRSQRNFVAEQMKINPNNFRWYAAFHNEGHHPHVHMIAYSTNPNEPYLTKQGIQKMRSAFTTEIFKQDLVQIYIEQTTARDMVRDESGELLKSLLESLKTGICENEEILEKLQLLATRLQNTSGKKQYGYLKADVKLIVDQIVDALSKEPSVMDCYEQWCSLRADIFSNYHGNPYEKKPLSEENEFRHIRNLVVREADRLRRNLLSFFWPESSGDDEAFLSEKHFDIPLPETEYEPPPEDDDAFHPASEMYEELDNSYEIGYQSLETDCSKLYATWSKRYKSALSFLYGTKEEKPDFDSAFQLLSLEAESGNVLAMHDIGRLFADGLGREIDTETSALWYTKALVGFLSVESLVNEKAKTYLQYRIGKMYNQGLGTEKDDATSALWFQKAVDKGHKYAQYSLAGLYKQGHGVEQNLEMALALYELSAKQGNQFAEYVLGKLYLTEKSVQNRELAVYWLTLSAEHGNEYATFLLNHMDDGDIFVLFHATSLLRSLASVFESTPYAPPYSGSTDRKTRAKLRQKKQAQGHASDDSLSESYGQRY